jgi:alkyl hydroperoxide reductase subunit AhpC
MKGKRHSLALFAIITSAMILLFAAPSESFRIGDKAPEVGKEAFDFTLPDTKGEEVSLSDFRGKVILLSFWSCYTDKCFTSVRIIKDLLAEFHEEGLVAPTVCSEIPEVLVKNDYAGLLKRCGTGQVVMVDAERDVKRDYKVRKLPSTYLIGRDFTVHEIVKGVARLREPGFRESIISLLEEIPSPPPENTK